MSHCIEHRLFVELILLRIDDDGAVDIIVYPVWPSLHIEGKVPVRPPRDPDPSEIKKSSLNSAFIDTCSCWVFVLVMWRGYLMQRWLDNWLVFLWVFLGVFFGWQNYDQIKKNLIPFINHKYVSSYKGNQKINK